MHPQCSICQSQQVSLIANDSISPLDLLLSSESLSALGASICKSYNLNPAIGAVAGSAIASAINSSKAKFYPVENGICYQCNNCQHTFSI